MPRHEAAAAVADVPLRFSYQPLGKWVLCKEVKDEKQGSIVLPQNSRSNKAVVVAIGDGCSDVFPGDLVLITEYGMDVTLDGTDYKLVRSDEIYLRKRVDD